MPPPRTPSSWQHPRDELVTTMQRIYHYQMTTTSGGNLSIRDADDSIWITPASVDKGTLAGRDIVHVLSDGRREGVHAPSSELPFHREIYRRRPDLRAIVHAHPGALVAFAICRQIPQTGIQSHVHSVCGRIANAPYACPGTQALGDAIATAFATGADCVLMENHGVVIGARDLAEAFQRFETLEFAAQTLIRAAALGTPKVLSGDALAVDTMPEYAPVADPVPSSREKELRASICAFAHRAYQRRLLISTAGALSARVEGSEFVITPRRRDRLEVQPAGIVRVNGATCGADQQPSRASRLHAEIYARDPRIGAVISAQPVHASAFCITDARFSTHTIPESYIVLNNPPKLPFLRIVEDAAEIARHLSFDQSPVILIENEGAVAVGRDLLQAFDRLEVLEATAEALLLSRPLGPMAPMPAAAIDELRQAYKIP